MKSDDPIEIKTGILNIIGTCSGPEGALVSALLGSLIITSFGSSQKKNQTEAQEDMMRRVVTEAIDEQTDDKLAGDAQGFILFFFLILRMLLNIYSGHAISFQGLYIYSKGERGSRTSHKTID